MHFRSEILSSMFEDCRSMGNTNFLSSNSASFLLISTLTYFSFEVNRKYRIISFNDNYYTD